VQEDARRVVWNGEGEGMVAISSFDRRVLSDFYEADSALFFDIKVDLAPERQAYVRLGCGPSCQSDIEVTSLLGSLVGKGWKTLRVDLACFPEVKTSFGLHRLPHELFTLVLEPFALVANGKMDVSFSRVYIEKLSARVGTFGCVDWITP
jgi:beta-glucosidase